MAMLMWILLHEIIDQDTQDNEPQEDECPRRRRPLGRGLEPRPPWCVIDPVHDRRLKTLSEEEIVEKRNAEEQRARIKRAKRTLTVVAWSVLTVAVVYFAYVRPLVFPDTYRVWLSLPKLGEFDPDSIRGVHIVNAMVRSGYDDILPPDIPHVYIDDVHIERMGRR